MWIPQVAAGICVHLLPVNCSWSNGSVDLQQLSSYLQSDRKLMRDVGHNFRRQSQTMMTNCRMCLVGISQHSPHLRFMVKGMIELKVTSVQQEELVSLDYGNETRSPIGPQTFHPLARLWPLLVSFQLPEMRIFHEILMLAERW